MTTPNPTIRVNVDPTNPGQFFACCGLLELADRFWPGAEGWFAKDHREFSITCDGTLAELVTAIGRAELVHLDEEDGTSGRIEIRSPFRALRIDWWHELGGRRDARSFKVWAGSMESFGIARAMQHAMRSDDFHTEGLFDVGMVVPNPDDSTKKKEPFYFDARRAQNAHSRDVGFSPNALGMTTTASPAVELLCLVGLQRCLPVQSGTVRVFDYYTWSKPTPPSLLPVAVAGLLGDVAAASFRFENGYRTGQKKHKAFRPAVPLSNETHR
jgi:CRISPR-associated protein Csx14